MRKCLIYIDLFEVGDKVLTPNGIAKVIRHMEKPNGKQDLTDLETVVRFTHETSGKRVQALDYGVVIPLTDIEFEEYRKEELKYQ